MSFWVYILTTKRNGMFYVGHTDDLPRRIWEHRTDAHPGFTSTYGIKTLVYAEPLPTREDAKRREARLKRWNRTWKMRLIEEGNPEWNDLYLTMNNWYSRDS
jgi:putative endonuclease